MARVLFLEDEEDLVEYLPLLLRERGLELVGSTSVAQALERVAKEDFDALLLDIMMPPAENMDAQQLGYGRETGVEVARRVKAIKPDMPIVALTVLTDPEIQAAMRKAGVASILQKPIEPERIADALRQIMGTRAKKR